jgi:hypothetical protein
MDKDKSGNLDVNELLEFENLIAITTSKDKLIQELKNHNFNYNYSEECRYTFDQVKVIFFLGSKPDDQPLEHEGEDADILKSDNFLSNSAKADDAPSESIDQQSVHSEVQESETTSSEQLEYDKLSSALPDFEVNLSEKQNSEDEDLF